MEARKMVNQIRQNVAPEHDKFSAPDIANSPALSTSRSQQKDTRINDELIVTLADAYENKRARQVNEWEKRQRAATAF